MINIACIIIWALNAKIIFLHRLLLLHMELDDDNHKSHNNCNFGFASLKLARHDYTKLISQRENVKEDE